MRTSAALAVLGAALAVALAPAAAAPTAPLLGIVFDGGQGHLARLDPETLRPLRTSPFLTNGYAVGPALSPDGADVVLGSTSFLGVRIVDLATLRREMEIRAPLPGGHVAAIAWPTPGRVLAAATRCCASLVLATVDVEARKVVRLRTLAGVPVAGVRTGDGLAFLLAPPAGIGPARLVTWDGDRVGVVKLGVRAGRYWPPGRQVTAIGTQLIPGLTVDPTRARAYVFASAGDAIEVDLGTGRVTRHSLTRRTVSKAVEGPSRSAHWLGNGLIAVTGVDEHARSSGTSVEQTGDPAGLSVVDVRRWTVRVVDADATSVTVGHGLLFPRGYRPSPPAPIRAYDFGGRLRFELTGLRAGDWLQTAGDRAYVAGRVLELPSGRVLRRLPPRGRVTILPLDGSQFPL